MKGNTAYWRTCRAFHFISFVHLIELTGRIHDQVIIKTFIVSQLKEDAILKESQVPHQL